MLLLDNKRKSKWQKFVIISDIIMTCISGQIISQPVRGLKNNVIPLYTTKNWLLSGMKIRYIYNLSESRWKEVQVALGTCRFLIYLFFLVLSDIT